MVDYRKEGSVAILEVNNPPVNALSHHVREALVNGVERANKESDVVAIVLYGKKQYLAGADIREFATGQSLLDPMLTRVCQVLEESKKPVISAIEGFALGGGLEVAISTHYRISTSKAMFGFPEVDLGLLPGATGTQRFPRLVGLKLALELIPTGTRYNANKALQYGVIDKIQIHELCGYGVVNPFHTRCVYLHSIVEGDLLKEAVKFAQEVSKKNVDNVRTSKKKIKDLDKANQLRDEAIARINKRNPGLIAPLQCIKAVINAVSLPFEEGCAKERDLMIELITSGQAAALQYAFFAQRKATQWELPNGANYKNTKALPIKSIAVIGAGTMGSGIVMAALNASLPVVLLEQDQKFLDSGVKLLKSLYEGSVKIGLLSKAEVEKRLKNLKTTTSYSDLANVDMVIEAVYENLGLKKKIFEKLDQHCKREAILCSNTSALNIDEMAAATKRPENVIGTHFFVPAYYMKILENIRGKLTSPTAIATATVFGQRLGKVPVLVGNCEGFVGNRLMRCVAVEALFLLEEGCTPEEVDQVHENCGFPMGMLKVSDLSGLDIKVRQYMEIAESKGITIDERTRNFLGERFSPLPFILFKLNRLGRKTGGGWYNYDAVNAKIPRRSEVVADLLKQYRRDNNIPVRKIPPSEIYERLYYSAFNEGFKILEEGHATRPEEIDTIVLLGYAWPRQTGGPMYSAQTAGLKTIYERILHYQQQHGLSSHWKPSALLKRLAQDDVPLKDWHKYCSPNKSNL